LIKETSTNNITEEKTSRGSLRKCERGSERKKPLDSRLSEKEVRKRKRDRGDKDTHLKKACVRRRPRKEGEKVPSESKLEKGENGRTEE